MNPDLRGGQKSSTWIMVKESEILPEYVNMGDRCFGSYSCMISPENKSYKTILYGNFQKLAQIRTICVSVSWGGLEYRIICPACDPTRVDKSSRDTSGNVTKSSCTQVPVWVFEHRTSSIQELQVELENIVLTSQAALEIPALPLTVKRQLAGCLGVGQMCPRFALRLEKKGKNSANRYWHYLGTIWVTTITR